ncbi:LysR family transcriptional regulator [Nonomuraea sp. C10]|uniref:LysR family transcriptional regulator n=1 Tax=Nonomuraea sp. C10 TaxID=2600577 RepID=UPI0021C270DD|nr:LysR family transcriptional regulator [Nonomuraea sp. C10]
MAREIQCFARVAARLSFSRAAADLGMSQPAVSQAVARLERATGVRLFERSARTVRLTAAGAALLPYAEQVLESAAAFTAEASRLARPVIHLAYPPLAGPLAARIARRMAGRTPPVAVELHAAGRAAAAAALDAGEVSAAILATPAPARFTTAARFHVTVDHLAVPPTHPLAARAPEPHLTRPSRTPRTTTPDTLRPAEARPTVSGGGEVPPASPGPGNVRPVARPESGRGEVRPAELAGLVVLTPGGRRWAGLPGHPRMVRDDDFGAALDLVAAGAGVLPIPHLLVRSVRRDDVVFVPLEGADLQITYALAWSRERVTNELLALVQAMQDALWTR